MKLRALLALSLALLAPACDPPSSPDTDTGVATSGPSGETDSAASTGDAPGYVCADVGAACDLDAPACSAGLDCVERPDMPGAGVCSQKCNLQDGPGGEPCAVGWCDVPNGARSGMCRDADYLPTGLCEGVPSCAGDPCEATCASGLSCIAGACAFACETAADCADGQACIAGACFDGDGLADPCN